MTRDEARMEYRRYNDSIPTDRANELLEMAHDDKRGRYDRTIEWRTRKKIRIAAANGVCEKCGKSSDKLNAHHCVPERYGNEDFDDLAAECPHCHKLEHKMFPTMSRHNRKREKVCVEDYEIALLG